jgi:GTP-binding protein
MRNGLSIRLLDTAGIRRKRKVSEDVEYYSVQRAVRTLEEADVAVLVVDTTEGLSDQDKKIAGVAVRRGRGMVVALNKWDLRTGVPNEFRAMCDRVRFLFPVLDFAPIVATSGKTGAGTGKLLDATVRVWRQLQSRISTPELNRSLREWIERNPPPYGGSKRYRAKYLTQIGRNPLVFELFVNNPKGFPRTWIGYVENRLREEYRLAEVPLSIRVKRS